MTTASSTSQSVVCDTLGRHRGSSGSDDRARRLQEQLGHDALLVDGLAAALGDVVLVVARERQELGRPPQRGQHPVSRPNFIELCEEVVPAVRGGVPRALVDRRAVGRLGPHLHVDRPQGRPARRSAGSCASSQRDLAYRSESPTLWDVDMRTSVAQAELEDRELAGAYHKLVFSGPDGPLPDRHHAARAARRPAWPSSPTPTTSATSRCSARRSSRRCSAPTVPIVAHALADPEKGTGVAMICTFGDTTDVTWWRELSLPGPRHRPARRPAAPDHLGRAGLGVDRPRRRPGRLRRAGRQDRQAGPDPHRRAAHRGRRHRGRDPPDHPPGEVLGERHPPARDRHQPAVVHPLPAQGRDAGPGQGADVVARLHAGPLRELGERAHRRLEHHPPAVLRRAVPGLVPDRRRRRHRLPVADPRRRGVAADRPHHRGAAGLRRVAAQPARRLRRRPRRDGHVGHVVAHPADRVRLGGRPRPVRAHLPDGPAPAGPRDHPHLAVLARSSAATTSTTACRGPTPPSPASSSTPTARSCRSRPATRPTTRWRSLAQHGADAVRYWAANGRPGHGHRRSTRAR